MDQQSHKPAPDEGRCEEALIEFLPAIRSIAMRILRKYGLRSENVIDDMVQAGALGFVEAARRYRPVGGKSCSEHALSGARYAIYEQLRASNPNKRAIRAQARTVNRLAAHLTVMFGRKPTSRELAATLGMEMSQYHHLRADLAAVGLAEGVYLLLNVDDKPVSVEDLPHQNQGSAGFLAEDAGRIERALAELPEKERMVLRLSYFASMELTEIAQRMGYQKSYISKLRKRGIERLAAIMRATPAHSERREGSSADRYCRPSLKRARARNKEEEGKRAVEADSRGSIIEGATS